MFSKKLQYRNLFLRQTCPNYKPNLIHNGLNEIFFRHLPTNVMQQRSVVKECLDFQKNYNRGYEKIGVENLVNSKLTIYFPKFV